MSDEVPVSLQDVTNLSALANGILPADERDSGAAAVHAGPSIAGRMRLSPYGDIYVAGLKTAVDLCRSLFDRRLSELNASQMHELVAALSQQSPAFFRQLRADVCVFYLSDIGVQARIGFPGPSTDDGGYPDFDQPQ